MTQIQFNLMNFPFGEQLITLFGRYSDDYEYTPEGFEKSINRSPRMFIFDGKYMQTFTAIIHREEDMFVAECPEVGTASQGAIIEEAVANLKEATQLYLDEFPIDPKPVRSFVTTFDVAEIAGA